MSAPTAVASRKRSIPAVDEAETEVKLSRKARNKVVRLALKDLKKWRWKIVLASLAIIGATLARLAGPLLISWGIDDGIRRGTSGLGVINAAMALWVVAAGGAYILSRWQIWLVSLVGENYLRELRVKVFGHIEGLHLDFFNHERSGRLVSRMTSDVESLQQFVSQGLIVLVSSILTFVLTLAIMFRLSWRLTLATLLILPPLILASAIFRTRANPAYLKVRERIANVLTRLQENLSGIRVVQAYGRERVDAEEFSTVNESHFDAQMRTAKISAIYFPVVEFLGLAAAVLILGFGTYLSNKGLIGFGVVAAFIFYINNLFDPIQQVSQLYNDLQAAAAALDKLYSLLEIEAEVRDLPGAVQLDAPDGRLELCDLTFGYDSDRPVLHNVSLDFDPGTRVALVGQTGAGKSTLVKLMTRFYDPDAGAVKVDGTDLKSATLASIRTVIGFVPQEGHIFTGTVWENIAYGKEGSTRDDVVAACRELGVLENLESLPKGLETEVEEKGGLLSAGQRQLVALARAFIANPRVLVLDEATSALDPATAAAVEDALPVLMKNRTSVMIAHRLTSAERADLVVLMSDGRPIEVGSHVDLVAKGGEYASLYESWTGGGRGLDQS